MALSRDPLAGIDTVWLRRLYEREGLSQRQIARALSTRERRVAQSVVCRALQHLRARGLLDEQARAHALTRNPPRRGGRPRREESEDSAMAQPWRSP
ncbi:MAG: hypothetical protein AAGC60_20780 [Acidobacteriota bacterium]